MTTIFTHPLKEENPHPRDSLISFEESNHVYTIEGQTAPYTSVTTWVHTHFEHFDEVGIIKKILANRRHQTDPSSKYYGKSAQDISSEWEANRFAASSAGTKMHFDIECFFNNNCVDLSGNNSIEFSYFRSFWDDFQTNFPLVKPFRTEWCVFMEELHIAGSIDMVFINTEDGTLWIYDWKRCKSIEYENNFRNSITPVLRHLPDSNFWHYSLQLNMYKYILESKYGYRISKMSLVCLHPENPLRTYQLCEVDPIDITHVV